MAYIPTNWLDRISANPGQFSVTGAVNGTIILTSNDNPIQEGTAVTAARMNHIEQGIVDIANYLMKIRCGGLAC